MSWRLVLTKRAERDLARVREADREWIRLLLDRATADPSGVSFTKLAGRRGEWNIPVPGWSVILELDNQAGLMIVTRILPRKKAYRR